MRHKKRGLQLNRFTSWRQATLTSLARSLLLNQSIRTTLKKAKAVKPFVEKLISLGKKDSLAAKRRAYRILNDHKLVSLLFNDLAPRFKDRAGGYTRILEVGSRRGDNAGLAVIELTEIKKKEPPPQPKKEKKEQEAAPKAPLEGAPEEKKTQTAIPKEKPATAKKPAKGFLKGIKGIFKKERDSL